MGRKITVHIDSDDLTDMLFDRVREWDEQIPWGARDLWYDFYAEKVADGYYDNMEDFNIGIIVDNDIVNYYSTFSRDEFISEYGIDPDDETAMEEFREEHEVFTDGNYFIVGAY